MVSNKYYCITRKGSAGDIVYFDYGKLSSGYDITPRNRFSYDGIQVNKLIIIKTTFIEKLLRKKIKKKLESYLQHVIDLLDDDDDANDGVLSEVLNDLTRYKDILEYKYRQHLNQEYVSLMIKKINILEYELKLKLMCYQPKNLKEVAEHGKGR